MSGAKVMAKPVDAGPRRRPVVRGKAAHLAAATVADADPALGARLDELMERAQALFSSAERMIARLG